MMRHHRCRRWDPPLPQQEKSQGGAASRWGWRHCSSMSECSFLCNELVLDLHFLLRGDAAFRSSNNDRS
ncbi:hypothetical protein PVAP13_5NG357200 [Panicum virgatum]|uniref:Uncharacterized protein n=1 Tax=Panicum virgatum TaxID=38727 RepID=A0A8T0RWP3_PANVG|nr:hypothetical protein PVAP13_5NG357200 [Panicum virgatum]